MTDAKQIAIARRHRWHGMSSIAMATAGLFATQAATAQTAPPPNIVGACSGVSLPRSVVTDIVSPVVQGVVTPLQGTVNSILGIGGLLPLIPATNIDAAGLLANAAAGDPVTLQVVNANGTIVGPNDRCDLAADGFSLDTPQGIAIGGNRITGLGSTGLDAVAGEANSIAFGNAAATDAGAAGSMALGAGARVGAGATGSIALGTGAAATGANGVALGAGSVAARGPLAGYAAAGLAGAQTSAGEVSVGAPGAERQITNVAAGTAATDAATVGQVTGVADQAAAQVAALADRSVVYDGADRALVTLGGAGGTILANVAPGALTATSTEAVNGAQLFATNAQVVGNTTAITTLASQIANGAAGPVQYADAATPTVANGGVPSNDVTLVGAVAGPVGLHNVAGGSVAAGSTDAVNGGQLATTNAAVTAAQGTADTALALGANSVQYGPTRESVTFNPGGAATVLGNVAAGVTPTDAANVGQLDAVGAQVAINTTAITNLANQIGNGAAGPVQYADAGAPTTPNGGVASNDVTLVGAGAGPVALHNVAGGSIAAGSTDAVNGGQVFALALTAVNAVAYDTDAAGTRTNSVTLAGGNAAAPVTLANVAAGTVAAGSTQAVNGAQLAATEQGVATAQGTANAALALGANAVQYGPSRTSVTFNNGGAATVLGNVGAGTSATDAANVGQLNAGIASAVTQSNAYTDGRIAALGFDLRSVRRDSHAGTSGALAAAGLPQAYEAGKGMIAIAGGTYGGQSAVAIGLSKAFDDGHTVARFSGTYDSRGRAGASGGVGYQF